MRNQVSIALSLRPSGEKPAIPHASPEHEQWRAPSDGIVEITTAADSVVYSVSYGPTSHWTQRSRFELRFSASHKCGHCSRAHFQPPTPAVPTPPLPSLPVPRVHAGGNLTTGASPVRPLPVSRATQSSDAVPTAGVWAQEAKNSRLPGALSVVGKGLVGLALWGRDAAGGGVELEVGPLNHGPR